MAYLLYGIVKDPPVVSPSLTGMKGRTVSFVAVDGLCAAVSEMAATEGGAPPVSELLVFSQVVEDLHCLQAVIPMRYGCFLNGIKAIQTMLKERQHQYETLLTQLTGRVEMGVRILLHPKDWHPGQEETVKGQDALATAGTASPPKDEGPVDGRAYLALRKVHYQMQDDTLQEQKELINRYIRAFSGLYTAHRIETDTKNGAPVLSLYFLTPEEAVTRFRHAFGVMMENEKAEALLSGPWPPYNFVTPDLAAAK